GRHLPAHGRLAERRLRGQRHRDLPLACLAVPPDRRGLGGQPAHQDWLVPRASRGRSDPGSASGRAGAREVSMSRVCWLRRSALVAVLAWLALAGPASPVSESPPRPEPVAETRLLMNGLAQANFRGL